MLQKNNIHPYLPYLLCLSIVMVCSLCMILLVGKTALFYPADNYHSFLLNVFFINITFLGDGLFAISLIAIIILYFKQKKMGLGLLGAFIISSIGVQIIKNLFQATTPKLFFESGQYLFLMDGMEFSNYHNFPSAHTATAFALATILVYFIKNKKWQIPLLIFAILVGYSRIYLAQHYLEDVIIGAVIGSLSGLVAISIIARTKLKKIVRSKINLINKNVFLKLEHK